ncbi:MAG: hypothetical protein IPL08_18035 [Saprospiraceae bacterium]|nr:hypothetical protein [Saprospiraceae bacterium]
MDDKQYEHLKASLKIEASYIGHMGKWLEPAIAPLGFDWKIGIALITSFAAREVFVGTMATIYSIGSESDEKTIREKWLQKHVRVQIRWSCNCHSFVTFGFFVLHSSA